MAERFDDLFVFLAPVFIGLLIVGVAIFAIETVVVLLVVSVVSAWRLITRRSWRVETTNPEGCTRSRTGLTFDEATTIAGRVKAEVTSGRSIDTAMTNRILP